jgi:tetratricopeptide (TPR) repeat protein
MPRLLVLLALLLNGAAAFAATAETPRAPEAHAKEAAPEKHATSETGHEAKATPVSKAANTASPAAKKPAPAPAHEEDEDAEKVEVKKPAKGSKEEFEQLQTSLELIRNLRQQRSFEIAEKQTLDLMAADNPPEIRRMAMLELAYIAQDSMELAKAQQIFNEYLRRYTKDASIPEVCLRQGLLYRQMGAHQQALAKFYQVMNYSLNLKLDRLDYYRSLVLKAQIEIAETYYLQGKYGEAVEYFNRLLKLESKNLDRPLVLFKLIRSLSAQQDNEKTIAQAQSYLELYPDTADVAEIRFLLADSLKKTGRNRDSMQQVMLLLQTQQRQAKAQPELWAYWQQRTGNEIANQLYKEGDYMSALEIYMGLARISTAAAWQLPAWYQIGLVYEHLKQPEKAGQMYEDILKRQMEVRTNSPSPALLALFDMAQWRRNYLKWGEQTDKTLEKLHLPDAPPEEEKSAPSAPPAQTASAAPADLTQK